MRDVGICIRHWDWSETSQTVSIITRHHGILRGLAKGSKREKGTFSGGIELLTLGEIQAIIRPRATLATLTSWDLLDPFRTLRASLNAFYVGTFAADLVGRLISDDDPHPDVFDATHSLLSSLVAPEHSSEALLVSVVRFQWMLLSAIGHRPSVDVDAATGRNLPESPVLGFSPSLGGFVAQPDTSHAWRVRRETREVLEDLRRERDPTGSEPVFRAVRLLAAYAHHLIGEELASTRLMTAALESTARSHNLSPAKADEPFGMNGTGRGAI